MEQTPPNKKTPKSKSPATKAPAKTVSTQTGKPAGTQTSKPAGRRAWHKPGKKFETYRKGITRPVGEMVPGLTKHALGRYGFGQTTLITDWDRIVGQQLAKFCRPIKILFPRGKRTDGTLHIRVLSAWATALQHENTRLIDRVNTYFGYGAVASIRLKQSSTLGPIRESDKKIKPNPDRNIKLDSAHKQEIRHNLKDIKDDEMRELLQRIGESVARRNIATKQD